MVVTGVGLGAGWAKSMTRSPPPAASGVVASPRGRMLQAPGTGSHRYSASPRPSSRGRACASQWNVSWSSNSVVQSMEEPYPPAVTLHAPPAAPRWRPWR